MPQKDMEENVLHPAESFGSHGKDLLGVNLRLRRRPLGSTEPRPVGWNSMEYTSAKEMARFHQPNTSGLKQVSFSHSDADDGFLFSRWQGPHTPKQRDLFVH